MAQDNLSEPEPPVLPEPPPEEPEEHHEGAPEWMVSFADLVTLLMACFVLLFAIGSTQQEMFKELAESMRSALGTMAVPEAGIREGLIMHAVSSATSEEEEIKVDEAGGMIQKDLEEVVSEVRELVMFNKLGGLVTASEGDMGAVITMTDMLLFEKGGSELSEMGIDVLRKLASVLSRIAYHVKVKGHTDNVERNSKIYPSNWELSAARASAVVRLLVESGLNPKYISAEGYAQYKPVATNDTEEGRARNRRVEIVYDRDIIAREFDGLNKRLK